MAHGHEAAEEERRNLERELESARDAATTAMERAATAEAAVLEAATVEEAMATAVAAAMSAAMVAMAGWRPWRRRRQCLASHLLGLALRGFRGCSVLRRWICIIQLLLQLCM